MIDWVFLTRIATIYSAAYTGKGCTVRAATPGRGYVGLASVHTDPALWEIEVDPTLPPRRFERVFWHEVAHCALKHPRRTSAEPGLGRADLRHLGDDALGQKLQRIAGEYIDQIEHDADELSVELQVSFEAAHGPLSAWAIT